MKLSRSLDNITTSFFRYIEASGNICGLAYDVIIIINGRHLGLKMLNKSKGTHF